MIVSYLVTIYKEYIDNGFMKPDDWEFLITSDMFTDEQVIYLVMYARRKNRESRNR